MYFDKLKSKIYKTNIGLLPITKDKRDLGAFNFWGLGGRTYKRKSDSNIIKYLFPAISQQYNTCGWAGEVGMKEIDEKVMLSPRSFVLAGKMLGYISGDGFSNLRNNELALKNVGIAEKTLMVETNTGWSDYSNLKYFTKEVRKNAETHRSKSFLRLYNDNQVDKAIDEGRPVSYGMKWFTGYNMRSGFKAPWNVTHPLGRYVGGHKMSIRGYRNDFYTVRNSYGPGWGDGGDFYVHKDIVSSSISRFGAFINYDFGVNIIKWVIKNNNILCRTKEKSTVYYITDGKKRPFRTYDDFKQFLRITPIFTYPNINSGIKYISKDILDQVPLGKEMLH